jgi:hypothetical protein
MSKCFQLITGFSCLSGLVLGVLALNPACRLVSSFRGNSAEKLSLGEELGRTENLKENEQALRRRRESKRRLAEEVIDQRLSLAEAIERFQTLDQDWPPGRRRVADSLGISEEEVDGQGVLIYVRFVLQSRQEETDAVLGRLKKELQELLASRDKRRAAPDDREQRKPGS